jgi:lysyl-tRNA synthetase class 1
MHSSAGNAVPIIELAEAYPPEIICWMIARRDPMTVIPFDPASSLFEEARLLRDACGGKPEYAESLAVVRSTIGISPALEAYPLDHLVLVAQLSGFDPTVTFQILRRATAYANAITPISCRDLGYIKRWLELYGAKHRIKIREAGETYTLGPGPLDELVTALRMTLIKTEWEAQAIHNAVHNTAKEHGKKASDLFSELYKRVIGQERGPKIGWLLETLGRERVVQLLN